MRKNRLGGQRGFTLLELLLSSVMVLLVSLAAYSAFYSGRKSYSVLETLVERNQGCRVFMERLSADLRNSFPFASEDARFKGDARRLEFYTLADHYENETLRRRFCRSGFLFKGNALLTRRSFSSSALEDNDRGYELFLRDVKECVFSYAAAHKAGKEPVWKDRWDDAAVLPAAVRVKLEFKKTPGIFTYDIFLLRR